MKHTPGPWEHEGVIMWPTRQSFYRCHISIPGKIIGQVIGVDRDEIEANAHLIAAAPELLESLKSATARLGSYLEWLVALHELDLVQVKEASVEIDNFRALIIKAEGGAQ